VRLQQINGEYSKNATTQSNGRYSFDNLQQGESYSIKPLDNASTCMAGVSTADLVKIQRHILGVKKFDTPYNFIAADANNSQSISAADMLEIRKLILGINQTLPNNRCWVYVDAKQAPDMANPFNFKEKIEYYNISSSSIEGNFTVVKMGDVNDTYASINGMVTRNDEVVDIFTKNLEMSQGVEYDVPIYVNKENGIEGLQFTIKYNPEIMVFTGYESSQIDPVESNFGYQQMKNGYITFSWNTFSGKEFDSGTPAFYLKFKALNNAITFGNININNDITTALSVINEEELPISFRFEYSIENDLVVYQNNPNPFTDETSISFNLPQDDNVEIKILDATGKILYTENRYFTKGLNHITLSKNDLNTRGVLYYSMKVQNDIITKKMILID
jgi:hypothetical protein